VQVTCEGTELGVLCRLTGNLEALTVPDFRDAVTAVPSGKQVIFDLSGVPFIDSAGLGALIGAIRRIREMGGEAAVCSPRSSVNRVLDIVGLHRIVIVARDRADAEEQLSNPVTA
jgi:anti-anti-sigma factor